MTDEPVEKLSEVLGHLRDLKAEGAISKDREMEILVAVQKQMQLQLKLHDAQIAALHELIQLLMSRNH